MKRDARAASVKRLTMAITVSCMALAACGGGSSAPPPPNLSSAPAAAAMNAYFQAAHTTTLTTTYQGNTVTYSQTATPNAGTTTFETATVQSASMTETLSENGTVLGTTVSTNYYTLNPFAIAGSVNSDGTQYEVVQSFTAIPATVTVGQSGALYNSIIYHDSTKSLPADGTSTVTYSVSADSPTVLDFCINDVITANAGNLDGLTSGTQENCYRVDSSGNATLFKITVQQNGATLTLL